MSEEIQEGELFADSRQPARRSRVREVLAKKDVRRRWLLAGVAVAVFAIAVSSLLSSKSPVPEKREEPPKLLNLTPANVDERAWQVRSQEDIHALKDENGELKTRLKGLQEQIDKLKAVAQPPPRLPTGIVPPPTMSSGDNVSLAQPPVVPPPPLPSASFPGSPGAKSTAVPPPYSASAPAANAEPLIFTPDRAVAHPPEDGPELEAKVRYKRNEQSGMMVAGAFAPVVLLNGIDAATSSGARSNPLPILMRVQDHAVLPGAAKYGLRSCFVLASGYGELSAERVYVRLARLSCVDKHDRLVLSVPVQGYVVDADNTLGMRGKVTDRQGARLGKAMLAGFAQGLSNALGGAQGTISTSALGTATALTGDEALRASGLSGASTAAGQLAQFYLKEAQAIFPVITVQGGRLATVVFTDDVNLTWGNVDAQFVREVEPQNAHAGS